MIGFTSDLADKRLIERVAGREEGGGGPCQEATEMCGEEGRAACGVLPQLRFSVPKSSLVQRFCNSLQYVNSEKLKQRFWYHR